MNNTKKSRVQGKCAKCGSSIPSAKRLCPNCRQKEDEVNQNIFSWNSPTGEPVKRQVPSVRVSERIVFSVWRRDQEQFTLQSSSGAFLESLIGLCYSRPPYIHGKDIARYVSLLDALMRFEATPRPWTQHSRTMAVQDMPLKSLGSIIGEWVMSFFRGQHHPLMGTFALDAACFVAAHGGGWQFCDQSPVAEIPPMVNDDFSFRCFDDPRFKHEFTHKIAGHHVMLAEVPDGGTIVNSQKTVFGPGTKFLFVNTRCYLSKTGDQYIDLKIKEDNSPKYDISSAFLPGHLWLDASGSIMVSPTQGRFGTKMQLDLPLRWVTNSVRESEEGITLLPIPAWE